MFIEPTFEEFRQQWLAAADIRDNLSPTDKGRRFAHKLLRDWLALDDVSDEWYDCDGACDGGIDIAYLQKATVTEGSNNSEGDKWYLVQSKYGSAFRGNTSLLSESQKILDTLGSNNEAHRRRFSPLTREVLEKLENFYVSANPEVDRIVFVFATDDDLSEREKRTLDDIRAMGRERIGFIFDVQSVSVRTIYENVTNGIAQVKGEDICVSLRFPTLVVRQQLNAGLVFLPDLYDFLHDYRSKTGNLERLYDKNVRQFLSRTKINFGIKETLLKHPEAFGMYNNGITIVVNDLRDKGDGVVELVNPYVVNGCQTTQTIWRVFDSQYNSGGTGDRTKLEHWKARAKQGAIVTKIVKVAAQDQDILKNITRFTNRQNAVTDKDMTALDEDFKEWQREMGSKYNIYLEIQRGGWDAYNAMRKRQASSKNRESVYVEHANAFDLIKVYGAGWLGKPGEAWNSNSPFLPPNGEIFKQLVKPDVEYPFGADDLYAAYRLHKEATENYEFGRIGIKQSKHKYRGPTRFLFYMIAVEILKDALPHANKEISPRTITDALIKLFRSPDTTPVTTLLNVAVDVIEVYMDPKSDYSIEKEPSYKDTQTYLRHSKLGEATSSPMLTELLKLYKLLFKRTKDGISDRSLVIDAFLS